MNEEILFLAYKRNCSVSFYNILSLYMMWFNAIQYRIRVSRNFGFGSYCHSLNKIISTIIATEEGIRLQVCVCVLGGGGHILDLYIKGRESQKVFKLIVYIS